MPSSEPWRCASDCANAHSGFASGRSASTSVSRADIIISPLSFDRQLAARERRERELGALVRAAAGVGPPQRGAAGEHLGPEAGVARGRVAVGLEAAHPLRGVDAEEARS